MRNFQRQARKEAIYRLGIANPHISYVDLAKEIMAYDKKAIFDLEITEKEQAGAFITVWVDKHTYGGVETYCAWRSFK